MAFDALKNAFSSMASNVTPSIGRVLDTALSGADISVDDATDLFDAAGTDVPVIVAAADHLRKNTVGDAVSYVVNRNINFTNVCVKGCGFCAFSRGHLAEEGYFLPI